MEQFKNSIRFTREYFSRIREVGSLVPSSRYLAKHMTKLINDKDRLLVVELGPGTGAFTRAILRRLPKNGTLIAVEINDRFADMLETSIRDTRLIIIRDGAQHLSRILAARNLKKADIVVSGLPIGNFSSKLRRQILTEIKECLKADGAYVQFQYFLSSIANVLSVFENVSVSFEPRNLPPAFVYTCRNGK